jgi:hypothetical protein
MRPGLHRRGGEEATDQFRPTTRRRRLLIMLLAVATAVSVLLVLLQRRAELGGQLHRASAPKACAQGRSEGCVGGKVQVIAAPPASGAMGARSP